MGGDSAIISPALTGQANPNVGASGGPPALPEDKDPNHFRGVKPGDTAAWPGFDPAVLRRFPPTMIMAAGRGFELSQAVQSHNLLIKAGVPAELNVWEGLPHGFYSDPALPESREVHDRIVRFFDMQFENGPKERP
jgi:acetyl esterase/lipase